MVRSQTTGDREWASRKKSIHGSLLCYKQNCISLSVQAKHLLAGIWLVRLFIGAIMASRRHHTSLHYQTLIYIHRPFICRSFSVVNVQLVWSGQPSLVASDHVITGPLFFRGPFLLSVFLTHLHRSRSNPVR